MKENSGYEGAWAEGWYQDSHNPYSLYHYSPPKVGGGWSDGRTLLSVDQMGPELLGRLQRMVAVRGREANAEFQAERASAEDVLALSLHGYECGTTCQDECCWRVDWSNDATRVLVAALRSAGFLIVHHTKET